MPRMTKTQKAVLAIEMAALSGATPQEAAERATRSSGLDTIVGEYYGKRSGYAFRFFSNRPEAGKRFIATRLIKGFKEA